MDYIQCLSKSPLFAGVGEAEVKEMLACLNPREAEYRKGEVILPVGGCTREFGLTLSGEVLIAQDDYWGNRNILAALGPGELFAESFAARPATPLNVSAIADAPTRVLFLDMGKVLTTCPSACPHHRRIIANLLRALSERNQTLSEKLIHLGQRGTRRKLLSYLSAEAARSGSACFEIPFDRQQLADYLCVDRSALSAQLSRLKAEGILDCHRNTFRLLQDGEK